MTREIPLGVRPFLSSYQFFWLDKQSRELISVSQSYRMDWCLLFRYKHVHSRTCKASLLGNKYLFNILWQQISERLTFPLSTVQASLTWLDAQVNGCTGAALSCREAWTWRAEKWQGSWIQKSVHLWSWQKGSWGVCIQLRKWQPTPVFLPGESQGWGSLVGCRLWGRIESDTTEAT